MALAPAAAREYQKRGWELRVQAGAGTGASFADDDFREAGVEVVAGRDPTLEDANVVLKVQPPSMEEVSALPRGCALVCHLNPLSPSAEIAALAERDVTSYAVELVPRITRAQKMDVLSSQATVAGYKAVLQGADAVTRFLADAHHRSRHGSPRQGDDPWRRRGRPSGDRHGSAARCGGVGVRHPAGREGAGAEPGRQVPRGGARRGAPRTRAATPRHSPRSSTSGSSS